MRSIYDAAVVMESGFGPDGDIYGNSRLETALACIKQKEAKNLILTGSLGTTKNSLKAREIAIQKGVPPERIKIANFDSFTAENNVAQAVKIAKENNFKTLLVITEKPHWFRVRYFFKKTAPVDLIVRHKTSMAAPLWYWLKEIIGFALLLIFPKHENSKTYEFIRSFWKRISPFREK